MLTMSNEIRIADFSRFPFGRYPSHGPFSGQRFREEFLVPAFRQEGDVTVDLAGARGLSPSFLEEAFGGLVRAGFSPKDILNRLKVEADPDASLESLIRRYVTDAGRYAAK